MDKQVGAVVHVPGAHVEVRGHLVTLLLLFSRHHDDLVVRLHWELTKTQVTEYCCWGWPLESFRDSSPSCMQIPHLWEFFFLII